MELRTIGDWLLEKDAQAQNALRYYLGPAYAPVNALAQLGAMMSPGADMMDMAQSSDALMHSPTWRDAGLNALGLGAATLGAFIPGTARGVEEAVDAAGDAVKGIRAYHGSPHDFDKFSLDKIGTGEGAQAYGHGLYFAGNEATAKSYRDVLSKKEQSVPGRMYEVNINADPADFLDWDKPLSEQPAAVQQIAGSAEGKGSNIIDRLYVDESDRIWKRYRSGEIPEDQINLQNPNVAVTQKLREAGIPGIKYLDQGSRAAGEGSRNYVVFDDNLVSILRKYGLLGMIGGGAGAAAMSEDYGGGA